MNELQKTLYLIGELLQQTLLKDMEKDILVDLYITVSDLREQVEGMEIYGVERDLLERYFQLISYEVKRRNLKIIKSALVISPNGKFESGREELKTAWKKMSFEKMMEAVEYLEKQVFTEAQRQALLNLAREVVMET